MTVMLVIDAVASDGGDVNGEAVTIAKLVGFRQIDILFSHIGLLR